MTLKHFFRINIFLIFLGIAIAGLWVYFTGRINYQDGFKEVRFGYIILLCAITGFCIFSRFIRWQFLLRRIGIRVPARPSLSIYLASLVGIATPAYLGELIRGLFLRRQFRVPIRITTWVFIVERLLDIAALGAIGMFTAHTWGMRKVMVLIVAVLLPIGFFGAMIAQSMGIPQNVIMKLRDGRILMKAFGMSLIAWVPASLLVGIAAAGLDRSVDLFAGMGIFSSATILGGVTLMPAGVGSMGSIAIFQLENFNIPLTNGVVVISLVRLMSVGVTLSIGAVFLLLELKFLRKAGDNGNAAHFNAITQEYRDQFTGHIWHHLLDRKISLIDSALRNPSPKSGIGLDIGCGLGQQCLAMSRRGYRVIGLDISLNLVQQAHMEGAQVVNGNALVLPFRESSLDFVYSIGALHHLQNMKDQASACREIMRVLKPGGHLIVHESNTSNPIFRFYMGYIFPIVKSIDEGTEWWIEPQRWDKIKGMKLCSVHYFTFLPDFIPQFLMRPFLYLERRLEASRLRFYSVHYMAVLQKEDESNLSVST